MNEPPNDISIGEINMNFDFYEERSKSKEHTDRLRSNFLNSKEFEISQNFTKTEENQI